MGTSIFVGKLSDPDLIAASVRYLETKAQTDPKESIQQRNERIRAIIQPWMDFGDEVDALAINTLNEASQVVFLEHADGLEGISSEAALQSSKWSHLPRWQSSVWLPFNGEYHKPVIDETSDWPIFIGTTPGLLADLTDIARLSPLQLGSKPTLFDKVLNQPTYDFELQTEETIRWVWFSYYFAATKSLERNVPCAQAG